MSKEKNNSNTLGKIAGFLRAVAGTPHPKNFTSVVICAAGSSTRMGGETTKQFLKIDGIPVVAHTLMAYEAATCIHEIIVVAKKDEVPMYQSLKKAYRISKLTKVVEGGDTRQDSARKGSDHVDKKAKYIAIADAARCLITPAEIDKICHGAYQWGAASAGIKATDTVKIVDKSAFIESTPDRAYVWLAQTPQVFGVNAYRAAAYACHDEGFKATDDNQLAEHIGIPVKMIECGRENIKVTVPSDILFAHAILQARKNAVAEAKAEAQTGNTPSSRKANGKAAKKSNKSKRKEKKA